MLASPVFGPQVNADIECVRQASQITDRYSAEWLAGYRAALAELDAVMASLGLDPVTPLVHARLKTQLLQHQAAPRAA